jgi:hypothetical protein
VSATNSRSRTRRAAAELAAHRRRLLDLADAALSIPPGRPTSVQVPQLPTAPDPDLDPTDAILLRVAPSSSSDHPPGHPADFPAPPLKTSSRVAVTGVTSHAGTSLEGEVTPSEASGLTDIPAHNLHRSAEIAARVPIPESDPVPGAALSADPPAFQSLSSLCDGSGTAAHHPSLTSSAPLPTAAGVWAGGRRGDRTPSTTDLPSAPPAEDPASPSASLISTHQKGRSGGFPAGVTTQGEHS